MQPKTDKPSSRADEEGDETARQFFSAKDLQLSPEEYAARHAQDWACFSFHEFRYRDPLLEAWVRRLAEILFTAGEVERCRERFLSKSEIAAVRKREAEDF